MLRAVIYRRVSSARQAATGESLDAQREACERYAAAQAWTVVGDYCEAGRSAFVEDLGRRPEFQRMLLDARSRRFDVVIVYELSRFARRQRVQFGAAGELEAVGVRVVSVTEPMDLDTIGGFVTYSVLAMQAELHSRILSRKMRDTRARERDQGIATMPAPRGMRWAGGCLVWDDAATSLPRRAFELAAGGLGTPDVLTRLWSEGYEIALSSLHYLLRNPAYIGELRHGGRTMPASWPPLIDRTTWDAVQALRASRHPANAVRATVRSQAAALLAGLVFCANCGAKLRYEHHEGRRSYYRCSCRERGGECAARPSRADVLDSQIDALARSLTLTDATIARARTFAAQELTAPAARPAESEGALRDALRRLGRAYADGAMVDAEYEQRRSGLLARLAAAHATAPSAAPVSLDRVVGLLADLPALWERATVPERRGVLGQLLTQVYARRHEVYAVRPTRLAEPILRALWEQSRATDSRSSSAERSAISRIALLAA